MAKPWLRSDAFCFCYLSMASTPSQLKPNNANSWKLLKNGKICRLWHSAFPELLGKFANAFIHDVSELNSTIKDDTHAWPWCEISRERKSEKCHWNNVIQHACYVPCRRENISRWIISRQMRIMFFFALCGESLLSRMRVKFIGGWSSWFHLNRILEFSWDLSCFLVLSRFLDPNPSRS